MGKRYKNTFNGQKRANIKTRYMKITNECNISHVKGTGEQKGHK